MSTPLTTEISVVGAEEAAQTLRDYFNTFRQGKGDIREAEKAS